MLSISNFYYRNTLCRSYMAYDIIILLMKYILMLVTHDVFRLVINVFS